MSLKKKIYKAYWAVEDWLSAHWNRFGLISLIALIFVFFAQADYISNKKKRDFSALPKEVRERREYVCKKELELWAKQGAAQWRYEFDRAKEINKIRGPLNIECNELTRQAPHSSWAYNFYAAIGAIDTARER